MTPNGPTDEGHRITADPDTVEAWAREYDVVPVGTPGEEPTVRFLPRSEAEREMEERERLEWSAVHDAFDRDDLALIDRGEREEGWAYDLLARSEVAERAALESEAVEQSLIEGETVTTGITETTVVETEITETATVEHEVVDRETIDSDVVDRELVDREVEAVDLLDEGRVALEVFDTVSITREVLERLLVESRIVGADVVERDTVESEEVEATVDVEGVQRTILESDVVEGEIDPTNVVEGGFLRSERGGDVITTEFVERRTVEEEVVERRDLVLEVVEDDLRSTEVLTSRVIESEIVDRGDLATGTIEEGGESAASAADVGARAPTRAEMDESAMDAAADAESTDSTTAAERAGTAESAETAQAGAPSGGGRTVPGKHDQGKSVVDEAGEEVGIVARVEGDVAYVDPHPTLTDRIKAALDWGEMDEESYPIEPEAIRRIDGKVVLAVTPEGTDEA